MHKIVCPKISVVKLMLRLLGGCGVIVIAAALAIGVSGAEDTGGSPSPAAAFVGSVACKSCHAKVNDTWVESPHGKALLQDSLPQERKGCEACHGPASLHVGNPAGSKPAIPTAAEHAKTNALCGACHYQDKTLEEPVKWQNTNQATYSRNTHSRKNMSCLSCHSGHPSGNDKSLIKPVKDLCLGCHASVMETSPGKKADYTHAPVAMGQCTTCHDVHGSTDRRMVIDKVEKTCETCHKSTDDKLTAAHMGYPVAGSACATCHDVHSHDKKSHLLRKDQHGPFAKRNCSLCHTKPVAGEPIGLVQPADKLCSTCHPAGSVVRANEKAHLPAKQGFCSACHDPHVGTTESGLMKTRAAYACFTCHTKVENDTIKAHRHKILDDELDCMMCHKPHSSAQEKLLVKGQNELCGACHKHQFSHPIDYKKDGTPVMDVTTKKPMTCASCHDNHGSDFAALTVADKKRDLCVKCHNEWH